MNTPSVWSPPRLSMRWWPVFQRNLLVWRKLAIPSLLANIGEPLLWLVAFGYGLGAMVGRVPTHGQEVPYILFLASGSICMSAMNAASFEAQYSAFSRMHVQKTWDGILNTPISLDDVVLAEMLWAGFKALFSVIAILGVMLALKISLSPKLILVPPILLIAGERDTSTPIANVELVAETAPRAALHIVEGSAHQVPVAAPAEVADQIRAFMDRSTPSLVVSESSD